MKSSHLPRSVLLAALLCIAAPAAAQPSQDECASRLQRARGQYQEQQFAEVERLIVSCVDRLILPARDMDDGFRLLTLAYLRENLLADAQATVIKHLAWSFTYEPDEVRDPPLYVALVRVTRAQLTVPPGALVASSAPAGAAATPAPSAARNAEPVTAEPEASEPLTASVEPVPLPAPSLTRAFPGGVATASPSGTTRAADDPASASADPPPADPALPLASEAREPDATDDDRSDNEPAVTETELAVVGTVYVPPPDPAFLETPDDGPPSGESHGGVGLTDGAVVGEAARYEPGMTSVPGTAATPSALLGMSTEPLDFAPVMPEIIGGAEAIRLEYPDYERRAGIEGRVVLRFVVGADGRVSQEEVLRGVGPGLNRAALDALRRLRFYPGRQNGEPVPVRMTLSFAFRAGGGDG